MLQPPRLSPKDAAKDGSKIPVPVSVAASSTSPTGKTTTSSVSATTATTTTTTLPASRARRPSTLQYCLKSTAAPRLAAPPPVATPDDRTAPDLEALAGDRAPSATVASRQPGVPSTASVWPSRIVAPKATPEDSLIDSCSTDGDDGPEYRLLSLTGDEIGHHLRATANTSHLDLLNRVSAPPTAAVVDDDDDEDFDVVEGRPVELCRDERPPVAVTRSDAPEQPSSPDPFRYVDVLAAAAAARTVNSCDAPLLPRRRPWTDASGHDRLVGSGTSLPARLAVAPSSSRFSTLPRSAASLLQPAACGADSESDTETLTPPAVSTRSSLSGLAAAGSDLTKKQFSALSAGGAAGEGSAGRLSATSDDADSPILSRLSPDSPVSRFCHRGSHALDMFYSPPDDDDDDDEGDDAGVVGRPLPTSTLVAAAGTFWRPVACTTAVDRRRRLASPPSRLSRLIATRSPPTYRRQRQRRPKLSSPLPSAAPLVGVIEGFSDVEGASISDEEDTIIRPTRPSPGPSSAAAQLPSTELQQSSRSCSSKSEAAVAEDRSSWLTMPVESLPLHRDSHPPATDTVWPVEESLRPRYLFYFYKPVGELARTLLRFKRPTRRHQTATVPIVDSFHLRVRLRQMLLLPEF